MCCFVIHLRLCLPHFKICCGPDYFHYVPIPKTLELKTVYFLFTMIIHLIQRYTKLSEPQSQNHKMLHLRHDFPDVQMSSYACFWYVIVEL